MPKQTKTKVLVTGAAGFIGSHMCEFLVDKGFGVIGVDCFTNYYSKKLKELNAKEIKKKGVKLHITDLTLKNFSKKIKPNFEYIYHFAAQPGISDKVSFETYVKNNIYATQNLINFALKNKKLKCFVNISTSSVYGYEATVPETAISKPASFYGVTKLAAEQLVLSQYRQNGFPACSIRLYSVYGPRERPEKLYTKLIKSIIENKSIPLFKGSENHSRSFTYVKDVVKGLFTITQNPKKCIGQIINLGSDSERKTIEGIRIIEKLLNKKAKIVKHPARAGDQIKTCAVIDKAKKLLNYNPTTKLEDGLEEQVKWYKDNFCSL